MTEEKQKLGYELCENDAGQGENADASAPCFRLQFNRSIVTACHGDISARRADFDISFDRCF
jgi:hypothetical protein